MALTPHNPADSHSLHQAADPAPQLLSSKERMRRVLCGERPDVVPAAPAYLSITLAPIFQQAYCEAYRRLGASEHSISLDHGQDSALRAQAYFESYRTLRQVPDLIEIHPGLARSERQVGVRLAPTGLQFDGGGAEFAADPQEIPGSRMLYRASPHCGQHSNLASRIRSAADLDEYFPPPSTRRTSPPAERSR